MEARRVAILAFDGVQALDVTGPNEVFAGAGAAAHACGRTGSYEALIVSVAGGPIVTESGLGLMTAPIIDLDGRLDLVVVPGGRGVDAACRDDRLRSAVVELADRSRRLATVCTGTVLAARCGLLDGRRVATHWARASRLAAEYPNIKVDPEAIYVRDGHVWSSAGVTAGIDLALAMVECDLGTDVAQLIARWLVMFLHRPGGQTQFSPSVWTPRAERPNVRAVQERIDATPGERHSITTMAREAAMSPRHFARVFTAEVGVTPGRYVELARVDAARRTLEHTDDTMDVIARDLGFGTAETLRRCFHRHLHVSPEDYRRRFTTTTPARASDEEQHQ